MIPNRGATAKFYSLACFPGVKNSTGGRKNAPGGSVWGDVYREYIYRESIESIYFFFLQKAFPRSLQVPSPGLNGNSGALHIFVVYLDPASKSNQIESIKLIGRHVDRCAHTVVIGDFNFVESGYDRYNKDSCRV